MSLQSLYTITDFIVKENEFSARIAFDPSHEIFSGHFPGQPIVPGVCLIHIVKEIANKIAGREVLMSNGKNIKFLNVIDPGGNKDVNIKGTFLFKQDDTLSLSASLTKETVVFFKFKGTFKTS